METQITPLALRAIEHLGGPRIVIAAVPGGIRNLARAAGVSPGRVSQVLRQESLPPSWAFLIASLIGCSEREVYLQLGQIPPGSPFGPLFDSMVATHSEPTRKGRQHEEAGTS
jgi:hypothetical protein